MFVVYFFFLCLDLETASLTTTTSTFEFASPRSDVGLDTIEGVGVVDRGGVTPVGLSSARLGSTEKDSVGSLGGAKGQLIKGDAFTSRGDNSLSGSLRESKSADRHLGAFHETDIIGDLGDNDSGLSVLVGHVL